MGVAAGLAGAVALTRYLAGMLFGLTPLDVGTYAASPPPLPSWHCWLRTCLPDARRK